MTNTTSPSPSSPSPTPQQRQHQSSLLAPPTESPTAAPAADVDAAAQDETWPTEDERINRIAPPDDFELAEGAEDEPRTPAFVELREIFFRHKERLAKRDVADLGERETDRQRVNELYPELQPGPERMLDARTLRTLVDSHAATQREALENLLAPQERLAMLAVVVRRHSFPVLTISGQPTLALSPLLSRPLQESSFDAEVAEEAEAARLRVSEALSTLPEFAGRIAVSTVDPQDMTALRKQMLGRARRGLSAAEIAQLSNDEAQLLSLVGGTRGVKLVSRPDGGLIALDISADDADAPDAPADPFAAVAATATDSADAVPSLDPAHRPHSLCLNFRSVSAPNDHSRNQP